MKNNISVIWREASGKLGEELLRHYLAKEGIVSFNVGETRFPFDLIVPIPDGTIFHKKAVIQVKTETQVKKLTPRYAYEPDKETFSTMLHKMTELGFEDYEFWLALLWINWERSSLRFVGCLCPATRISPEDFRATKKPFLLFWNVWKKSPLKFGSKTPNLQ